MIVPGSSFTPAWISVYRMRPKDSVEPKSTLSDPPPHRLKWTIHQTIKPYSIDKEMTARNIYTMPEGLKWLRVLLLIPPRTLKFHALAFALDG